ncbi:hypothetical protein SAMN04515648_4445 [Phyllobacterium sp. CL33Tsu]|uniref:nSTAND1 domain-containing NTPase n=1 Tax=Phyllobacterium sp. CL33Tsu TaxID=1798191 RepID=UPI0008EA0BDA|nr:hypothetical protein [Phyllobacterium sp. CL33Tsu]SFJ53236.1 hypothetical protein SAMN04515648_4445 [Phyllobacterium sp. CL33Tsu]
MNVIPGAATDLPETHAEIFIRRWLAGDKSCFAKGAGILITTPYPGLRSFRRDLARYFCGRETQKRDLKKFFANRETENTATSGRMTFVVGGSGSGKSSLTRAGLIAELDSIPIKGQWGAWYVAEMRPAKDPIGQLQQALWSVLRSIIDLAYVDPDTEDMPKGDFPERSTAEKSASIRGATDRIRGAAREFGIEWPDDATQHDVETATLRWLDREISPTKGTISTRSVFDFVSEVLATFDEAASYGERSGRPLLLLHIDQFEEIFRKECDADGRKALIGLLRDIYEYKPACLFAVATMRSEELHRFSEYAGMAEVINSSMYLVDLVTGDDIEAAIVEPAGRLAKLWELPLDAATEARIAPYTAESVKELKEAYREAGEALQHKADKLPLLQHFLPLVWEHAVDDWIARRAKNKDAQFEIDTQHLASVPGWTPTAANEQVCRLGRCLNAAADRVFAEAEDVMTAMAKEQGFKGGQNDLRLEAEGILSVSLCCLAQLDDGGQAVRKFVSVDEMLATSAGAVRLGTSKAAKGLLRSYLRDALQKFEDAGLVELLPSESGERSDIYNVTHESLIRNWAAYKQHLELQKRLEQRLAQLAIQELPAIDNIESGLLHRLFHRNWEAASTLIPSESQATLRLLFGPDSRYSDAWAKDVLVEKKKQLVSIGDTGQALVEPDKRIRWIGDLWRDAVKWREWGSKWVNQLQTLVMWGVSAIAALAMVALGASLWANNERVRADGLAVQLNRALAVNDFANSTAPRNGADDRALKWLIDTVKADYQSTHDEQQKSVLRKTIGLIDTGARAVYGADLMVSFEPGLPKGEIQNVDCKKATENSGALDASKIAFKVPSPFDGNPISTVTKLECGSKDGNWVFRLDVSESPSNNMTTRLDTYVGLRRLNTPTQFGVRGPRSTESGEKINLLVQDREIRTRLADVKIQDVKFVQAGAVVGFLIPNIGPEHAGKRTNVYLWTTTGLSDPIQVPTGMAGAGLLAAGQGNDAAKDGRACRSYKVNLFRATAGKGGPDDVRALDTRPTYRTCDAGPVDLDTNDKQLVVYRAGYDNKKCLDDLSDCQNTIEVQYRDAAKGLAEPDDGHTARTRIVYIGPKIIDAGVQGDWLWLEDVKLRKWRYLVGTQPLSDILEMRWQNASGASLQGAAGFKYRLPQTCKDIAECKAFVSKPDKGWPGVEDESNE